MLPTEMNLCLAQETDDIWSENTVNLLLLSYTDCCLLWKNFMPCQGVTVILHYVTDNSILGK